jgi:hypothetical protein
MRRYMIEVEHQPGECERYLAAIARAGAHYATNAEWGCEAGVHKAWLIIEVHSAEDARLAVPPILRDRARPVRLTRYSLEGLRAVHETAAAVA